MLVGLVCQAQLSVVMKIKKKYVVKHTYHNLATSKNYLSKS